MGLLRRIKLLIKLWLREAWAPATDPREAFAPAYQRQRELLLNVRKALSDIAGAKRRMESKTQEARGNLPKLEEQARRALIAEREDLARLPLQRRHVAALQLETLVREMHEVEAEEGRLALVEQRLGTQIEAYHARMEVFAARYSAAEAQARIASVLSGISDEFDDLGVALEEAERKTEGMEARAAAIDQLVEIGVLEAPGGTTIDPVARQLSELDTHAAVEDQLSILKRELGGDLPPPAEEV